MDKEEKITKGIVAEVMIYPNANGTDISLLLEEDTENPVQLPWLFGKCERANPSFCLGGDPVTLETFLTWIVGQRAQVEITRIPGSYVEVRRVNFTEYRGEQ